MRYDILTNKAATKAIKYLTENFSDSCLNQITNPYFKEAKKYEVPNPKDALDLINFDKVKATLHSIGFSGGFVNGLEQKITSGIEYAIDYATLALFLSDEKNVVNYYGDISYTNSKGVSVTIGTFKKNKKKDTTTYITEAEAKNMTTTDLEVATANEKAKKSTMEFKIEGDKNLKWFKDLPLSQDRALALKTLSDAFSYQDTKKSAEENPKLPISNFLDEKEIIVIKDRLNKIGLKDEAENFEKNVTLPSGGKYAKLGLFLLNAIQSDVDDSTNIIFQDSDGRSILINTVNGTATASDKLRDIEISYVEELGAKLFNNEEIFRSSKLEELQDHYKYVKAGPIHNEEEYDNKLLPFTPKGLSQNIAKLKADISNLHEKNGNNIFIFYKAAYPYLNRLKASIATQNATQKPLYKDEKEKMMAEIIEAMHSKFSTEKDEFTEFVTKLSPDIDPELKGIKTRYGLETNSFILNARPVQLQMKKSLENTNGHVLFQIAPGAGKTSFIAKTSILPFIVDCPASQRSNIISQGEAIEVFDFENDINDGVIKAIQHLTSLVETSKVSKTSKKSAYYENEDDDYYDRRRHRVQENPVDEKKLLLDLSKKTFTNNELLSNLPHGVNRENLKKAFKILNNFVPNFYDKIDIPKQKTLFLTDVLELSKNAKKTKEFGENLNKITKEINAFCKKHHYDEPGKLSIILEEAHILLTSKDSKSTTSKSLSQGQQAVNTLQKDANIVATSGTLPNEKYLNDLGLLSGMKVCEPILPEAVINRNILSYTYKSNDVSKDILVKTLAAYEFIPPDEEIQRFSDVWNNTISGFGLSSLYILEDEKERDKVAGDLKNLITKPDAGAKIDIDTLIRIASIMRYRAYHAYNVLTKHGDSKVENLKNNALWALKDFDDTLKELQRCKDNINSNNDSTKITTVTKALARYMFDYKDCLGFQRVELKKTTTGGDEKTNENPQSTFSAFYEDKAKKTFTNILRLNTLALFTDTTADDIILNHLTDKTNTPNWKLYGHTFDTKEIKAESLQAFNYSDYESKLNLLADNIPVTCKGANVIKDYYKTTMKAIAEKVKSIKTEDNTLPDLKVLDRAFKDEDIKSLINKEYQKMSELSLKVDSGEFLRNTGLSAICTKETAGTGFSSQNTVSTSHNLTEDAQILQVIFRAIRGADGRTFDIGKEGETPAEMLLGLSHFNPNASHVSSNSDKRPETARTTQIRSTLEELKNSSR